MTQTIALNGAAPEINPLYIKLRRRFAYPGDQTIGEYKMMQAISDGYQPRNAYPRAASGAKVSETHVTQANSLPAYREGIERAASRTRISGTAVLLSILAAVLMLFLILSGAQISSLNQELRGLQNNALYVGNSMTMTPDEVHENNAAAPSAEDAEAEASLSNLLRAFSEK